MHLRGNIFIYVLCCLLLVLSSCEVIKESERLIEVPMPADTTGRAHVLIEYTGFRCVNCPKAAESAAALKELYGERLIVVSMHPASNPFTQGAYDYTCEAADVLYQYMGGTATTPFPIGNIDLAEVESGWLSEYTEWPALLAKRMSMPAEVHMTANKNELTLFAEQAQTCRLAIWLVEDSVQGAQALPDGSVDKQYYHRHVLRGTVGDPWGEILSVGLLQTKHTVKVDIPDGCNPKHCSAVAVLLNEKREVLDAIEIREI